MNKSAKILILLCVWLCMAGRVYSDNLGDQDFSLRFGAAMSRIANYPDVAGFGGASAGSPFASSVNPASMAWTPEQSKKISVVSPIYTHISFEEDTQFDIGALSYQINTKDFGTFLPVYINVDSNKATTLLGLDFEFDAKGYNLQWANMPNERLATGLNLNVLNSASEFTLGNDSYTETTAETYGVRVGGLYDVAGDKRLLSGIVFDYAYAPSRTITHDVFGLGVGDVKTSDISTQYLIRPGLSYEYMEDSRVYADYQFGYFKNASADFSTHRYHAGLEQKVFKFLYVRGGTILDDVDHTAWTSGVGIYPFDSFSIDLAYQNDLFPELTTEFGPSRLWTASVSLAF